MARQKKPRDYFEPWVARKCSVWESGFRSPPAAGADPDVVERWHADKERASKRADWTVWGSRMWGPSIGSTVAGQTTVSFDGRGIVATVRPIATDHANPPSMEEVAGRIAECVSACRGVIDPADVLARTRSLSLDMTSGKADASDPRVLALLARLGDHT